MKKFNLIAVIAIAVSAAFSCNLGDAKPGSDQSLVGKWKIQNIHSPDSSSSIGALLIAMAFGDSVDHHFQFTKDSVTFYGNGLPETSAYELDEEKKEIKVGEDNDQISYHFLSDSTLQLKSTDSTIIVLVKK